MCVVGGRKTANYRVRRESHSLWDMVKRDLLRPKSYVSIPRIVTDHDPSRSEFLRGDTRIVVNYHSNIIIIGYRRVEGILAVSRAFGDRRLKKYVCAEPEIKSRVLA